MPSHFARFLTEGDSPLKDRYGEPDLRRLFSPAGDLTLTWGGLAVIPRMPGPGGGPDAAADAFERALLGWVERALGVTPLACGGTNAQFWDVDLGGHPAEFVVVGRLKNTASPPGPWIDWLLRVEEPEPLRLTALLARYFADVPRIQRRVADGKVRTQFKSTELRPGADLLRDGGPPAGIPARPWWKFWARGRA